MVLSKHNPIPDHSVTNQILVLCRILHVWQEHMGKQNKPTNIPKTQNDMKYILCIIKILQMNDIDVIKKEMEDDL